MAQQPNVASISDDEATHDHDYQDTPDIDPTMVSLSGEEDNNDNEPQSTTCRGNSFKPRKSIIDKGSQATFWGISSFKDTSLWTEEQKHDAIEQAYRLAKHYIKVIKEHSDIFT
jgi:hypothetical protein